MSENQIQSTLSAFSLPALEAWLSGLPLGNPKKFSPILYSGLLALDTADLPSKELFLALEFFNPVVCTETEKLSALVLMTRESAIEPKLRKLARLCAQFHLELAQGYLKLAKRDDFSAALTKDQRAATLYSGAKSLEIFQFRMALMAESTGTSFSRSLNEIFSVGATLGALFDRVSSNSSRSGSSCLMDVIKRILLFALILPTRIEREGVRRVKDLIRESADLAILMSASETASVTPDYLICLEDFRFVKASQQSRPADLVFSLRLSTRAFRDKVESLCHPTVAERIRLPKRLGMGTMIRLGALPPQSAEHSFRDAVLVCGFAALLRTATRLNFKIGTPVNWLKTGGLELLPLSDHEAMAAPQGFSKSIDPADVRSGSRRTGCFQADYGTQWAVESGEFACEVARSEIFGFYLIKMTEKFLPQGHLVGVNMDDAHLQVGVVFQAQVEGIRTLQGFELLGTNPAAICFSELKSSGAKHHALLFCETRTEDSESSVVLITEPLRFKLGDLLKIEFGEDVKNYVVTKSSRNSVFSFLEVQQFATPG
jgi:hypothetical protein